VLGVLGAGDAATDPVALVVLERPEREGGSRSPGDVVGSLAYSALDGLPDEEPITEHVGPILSPVGAGEAPADVLKRLPESQTWVPVLYDARIVAVVPRAALIQL
jgi:hypothetical protein